MKNFYSSSCLAILSALLNFLNAQPPKAPSQPVTETYFGNQVTDPYRNLENLGDSTVMNWYKAQAAYTEKQLSQLPIRETIYKELKELDEKFSYKINVRPNLKFHRMVLRILY